MLGALPYKLSAWVEGGPESTVDGGLSFTGVVDGSGAKVTLGLVARGVMLRLEPRFGALTIGIDDEDKSRSRMEAGPGMVPGPRAAVFGDSGPGMANVLEASVTVDAFGSGGEDGCGLSRGCGWECFGAWT